MLMRPCYTNCFIIEDDGQYFMVDEGSDGPSAIIIKVF